jgi:HK97 family phage major capsid protein/ATP-dependent Clp endopeptidase proteolytic subunit ClpP
VEILIYDEIGEDWFAQTGVDAHAFVEALRQIPAAREIVVALNSPGGNVHDGIAIYHALAARRNKVTMRVDGLAASIASIIALAGKTIQICEGARMMIHDPYALFAGNADAMRKMAGQLDGIAEVMAGLYARKTGKTPAEMRAAMKEETFYTAQQAVDAGLADEVLEPMAIAASLKVFDLANYFRTRAALAAQTPASVPTNQNQTPDPQMKLTRPLYEAVPAGGGGAGAAAPAASAAVETVNPQERTRIISLEQNRARAIVSLGQKYKVEMKQIDEFLANGKTEDDFRKMIMETKFASAEPINLNPAVGDPEMQGGQAGHGGNRKPQSIGDLLIASDSFKAAMKSGNRRSINATFNGINSIRAATLLTTNTTAIQPVPGVYQLEQQPLTIAALIPQGTTDKSTIRVTQETAFTNAATAVAEEGQKPEATFTLAEVDFPVRKLAVIGRVSEEMLDDHDYVRDYINQRLIYMVQAKEDNHLLNGTGSNDQIKGILQTSGIGTVASGSYQNSIDAIFAAMINVMAVGFFQPDAIVMHPTDWQNIKLTKDGNNQYLGGGPFTGAYGVGGYTAAGQLWGLPVIATTAIAQGTILVGAFRLGCQIFRRMGITVDSTNSDASDFVYNRICFRVEERLGFPVWRPLAFCTVTGVTA